MKTFLVALMSGGVQEQPEFTYSRYQLIDAENKEEAVTIYNEKNRCSYYYGHVIGEVINGSITVPIGVLKGALK